MAKKVCHMEKASGMLSISSIAKHIKSIWFYDMVKLAIISRKIYPNLAIDQTWKFLKILRILLCFVCLLRRCCKSLMIWNLFSKSGEFHMKKWKKLPRKNSNAFMFTFLFERWKFCQRVMWNAFVKIAYHTEMQNEN
jgi:hypothetical protein